jgi:hypothetical protein
MGRNFPNAFQGYTLTVKEAHQSTKVKGVKMSIYDILPSRSS